MAFIGRMFLFFLVNALVITTMTVILNVLGVKPYLNQYGLDIPSLAIFCAVWGMGGSFISLLISRWVAKWTYRIQLIPPNTTDPSAQALVQIVHDNCRKAGIDKMPEIGIYQSDEPNAFATGPAKSMALVAVSTGLLQRMNRAEIEAVLGHEISHIANGDMVTMTLLQGVVNAFVMFLSRLVAFVLTTDRDNRRSPGFAYYIIQFVLQIVFMILGSLVVAAFSRWREFRADAGSAKLVGREKMVAALQELQRSYEMPVGYVASAPAMQNLQISTRPGGMSFLNLWASHPPLEERIRRLQEGNF
jgi:heat shock protein HtpX